MVRLAPRLSSHPPSDTMTTTTHPKNVFARDRKRPRRGALAETGMILGRSLFPISAVLLIAGALLWGPWFTLIGAALWWRVVASFA